MAANAYFVYFKRRSVFTAEKVLWIPDICVQHTAEYSKEGSPTFYSYRVLTVILI